MAAAANNNLVFVFVLLLLTVFTSAVKHSRLETNACAAGSLMCPAGNSGMCRVLQIFG